MSTKWIIFFSIIVLWILGGIGLIICLNQTTETNLIAIETTKNAFLILGGLGVVLPVYLNVWGAVGNSKMILVENTFKLIEKYETFNFIEPRKEFSEISKKRDSINDADLIELINSNQKYNDSLIMLMNYWEMVRLSLDYKRANIKIIKEYIGDLYIELYDCCYPWINSKKPYKEDAKKLYLKLKK